MSTPTNPPLPKAPKASGEEVADSGLAPVTIPGEPISATVLKERR
jgi:hypothetical protein